jgi:hypothetical protein
MLREIKRFILEANQAGYASGNSGVKESDGSKTIAFEKGDWKYHDNYFGGEPYGGREVIFYQGKPVWMMVYYGRVLPEVPCESIYPFLQEALRAIPEDNPYRGPRVYSSSSKGMEYHNSWDGELDYFFGEENIYIGGQHVYHARYAGGLVDQRRG